MNEDLKKQEAEHTITILKEISDLLNTGLDQETIRILVSLIEQGVNPEALALIVKEIRKEGEQIIEERKRNETQLLFQPDQERK
ncbi:mitotic-spindle organizing protein [Anaeramoeba ignava]|uniref:Mitotic-spindle organizing protein n=1 Tax=Anaeramoeba ignava TaxID=1746090 RepID=A0A9Q0LF13_ANAIG|nr:mitotic-spindle organizing protein [Anaeramoeba ignava]